MCFVLIVEDSPVDQRVIRRSLTQMMPGIRVQCVQDPFEAREIIVRQRPDLVVLDVNLPRMSGGQFLGHLMRSVPTRVVVVTGTVDHSSDRWSKLMELGAVSVIAKPESGKEVPRFQRELREILVENGANPETACIEENVEVGKSLVPDLAGGDEHRALKMVPSLIGIGASTGGPQVIEELLVTLRPDLLSVLITQHISELFVDSLIRRLDERTPFEVKRAEDGERVRLGFAYVASPNTDVTVTDRQRIALQDPRPTCRFRPSVDVLFESLAKRHQFGVAAVLLTGMGDDGARGLKQVLDAGGMTIAQDEATCSVYGMPRQAVELNAAQQVLPAGQIAPALNCWADQTASRSGTAKSREAVSVFPSLPNQANGGLLASEHQS